jgi:hypothetical protein
MGPPVANGKTKSSFARYTRALQQCQCYGPRRIISTCESSRGLSDLVVNQATWHN